MSDLAFADWTPCALCGWVVPDGDERCPMCGAVVGAEPEAPEGQPPRALTGEQLKAAGMEAAERGAGPEWTAEARAAVVRVAERQPELTTDDVWRTGLSRPREPRALGPIMSWALRARVIAPTGRSVKTRQAKSHSAPIAIWASCVFTGAES